MPSLIVNRSLYSQMHLIIQMENTILWYIIPCQKLWKFYQNNYSPSFQHANTYIQVKIGIALSRCDNFLFCQSIFIEIAKLYLNVFLQLWLVLETFLTQIFQNWKVFLNLFFYIVQIESTLEFLQPVLFVLLHFLFFPDWFVLTYWQALEYFTKFR